MQPAHPNIWRPFTQMQGAETLKVVRGEGAYLILEDGRKIFDAIGSWWVNAHGHAHPHIVAAIAKQANELAQVIFTQFSHQPAETLAERICALAGEPLHKVFFSDNGSTAVEVALKIALQYADNKGQKRSDFIAFEHAYHGDTFGAMTVSGRSIFTRPFEERLTKVHFVPLPNEHNYQTVYDQFESLVREHRPAAFIFEPLVQGAAGMRMYAPQYLDTLIQIANQHNVLTIADEVMTGFYRTGTCFAIEQLHHQPDMLCLSKALTGGYLPLGLTLTTDEIFDAFLSNDRSRTFFHGHSYTANPIACAAANASLDVFESHDTQQNITRIANFIKNAANTLAIKKEYDCTRAMGNILAFELKQPYNESTIVNHELVVAGWEESLSGGYLNPLGSVFARAAFAHDIFIRPLGNTVYLLPPYVSDEISLASTLDFLMAKNKLRL